MVERSIAGLLCALVAVVCGLVLARVRTLVLHRKVWGKVMEARERARMAMRVVTMLTDGCLSVVPGGVMELVG